MRPKPDGIVVILVYETCQRLQQVKLFLCCFQVGTRAEEIARELGRISAEAASEGSSRKDSDRAWVALSNATEGGLNGTEWGVDWESQVGDVAVAQAAFEQQRNEDFDDRMDRVDRIDRIDRG
jgi:hypothetical protein